MSYEQAVVNLQQTNAKLVKAVTRVRDAAMGMNRMYSSISAGVAAVQDGEYFVVPGGGVYQRLYQRSGGSATLIAEYPDASEVVVQADIGTAAALDVTTSPTDTTAGRLMKVGDFGVGATQSTADPINTITVPGVYSITGSSQSLNNVPLDFHEGTGVAILWVANRSNTATETVTQRFLGVRLGGGNRLSGREFFRYKYTDAEGWAPWVEVFNSASILGAVSQSGGVPTGAVIERGSNTNGRYTKYADGTLICDNSNNAITTNPAAFVGSVTSIDGDKLRIGTWF